jgi:hypothetical protein
LAALLAGFYLLRPEFFILLVRHGFNNSPDVARAVGLSLLVWPAARIVAWRIAFGQSGWIRHLPAPAKSMSRWTSLSILVAQTPLLAVLWALSTFAAGMGGAAALVSGLGLTVLGYGAAIFVCPGRRAWPARLAGALAGGCGATGRLEGFAAGVALLVISDALDRPIDASRRKRIPRARHSGRLIFWRVNFKAMSFRAVIPVAVGGIVLLLPAVLVLNNPLTPAVAAAGWRFGGSAALAAGLAVAAGWLARRRPIWPWSRSLPLSSGRRIVSDSGFFLALLFPLFPALLFLDARAVPAAAAFGLAAALRAAGAARPRNETDRSAVPAFLLEGLSAAALLALAEWISLALLLVIPLVFREASRRERVLKPGRWLEQRVPPPGDTQTWSRS